MSQRRPRADDAPMSASIPSKAPDEITKGDSASWYLSLPDYPASAGFTLKYDFAPLTGGAVTSFSHASATGDQYLMQLTSDDTDGLAVGDYLRRCYVTDGGSPAEVHTIERDRCAVLDPLSGTADRRIWLERVLQIIEDHLEGRLVDAEQSVSWAPANGVSRSVSLASPGEMQQARKEILAELATIRRAEARARGEHSRRIRTRLHDG